VQAGTSQDRRNTTTLRLISAATVIAVLLVWFTVSNLGLVSHLFMPTPQSVWYAFVDILQNGYKGNTFWQHLGASLERVLLAFLLAVITAVPLGLASGFSPKLRAAWEPIIEFYRPLPPLAYYTLLVIWLGIDNESKIALLFLACFAPIYVSCISAVRRIPPNYIRNAATLGASKMQIFKRVIFPLCLPEIFSAMRIAMGVGYTTLVASEMVAARSGIGWMVVDASNFLHSEVIFVGIIVIAITAIILDRLMLLAKRLLVPWEGQNT